MKELFIYLVTSVYLLSELKIKNFLEDLIAKYKKIIYLGTQKLNRAHKIY
jgi:hypothetical protein